jgi:hypothetical protein
MKVVSQAFQIANVAKREPRIVLRLAPVLLDAICDRAPHRGLQGLVLELLQRAEANSLQTLNCLFQSIRLDARASRDFLA